MSVAAMDAAELGRALRARELSAQELARTALERAEKLQPMLGMFAELTPRLALEQARVADRELRQGRHRGPLHGLPVAVKDVIDVDGVPTRLGTPGAGHRVPRADARVVGRLRRAGAVIVGKTATHELALGTITPQTRNPHDPERIVGGSSGGSAAAVAAGVVAAALGTDTAGSVRIPAALCGVTGAKTTHGVVPRQGVAPLAPTQDTVGALALTPSICADVLRAIADPAGTGSARTAERPVIGVAQAVGPPVQDAVAHSVRAATEALASGGARIVNVEIDDFRVSASVSLVVVLTEAAAAWRAVLDDDPSGFGADVAGALRAGAELPGAEHGAALRLRRLLRQRLDHVFAAGGLDAILTPTVPITAAPAGAATIMIGGEKQWVETAHTRFTTLASVTGLPAVTVPCGVDADGLPIGLQLLGRHGSDLFLLELAADATAAGP